MNINLTVIVAALVFLTFVVITMKFIWPPLLKAIEERQKKISEGLMAAEEGMEQLRNAETEAHKILYQARTKAGSIVSAGEKAKQAMIQDAKSLAKAEGDRLLEQAKSGIAIEVEQAKTALQTQVAGIALAAARQILGKEINAQNHDELLRQLAQKI